MACDWNGTLVNDHDRAWSATCSVLERRGLPVPSLPQFLAEFRLPLSSLFAHYGVDDGVRQAVDDWNGAMAELPVRAMPGAKEMLERFSEAGIVVAVVSAASPEVLESDLALLGFHDHVVRFVFGSADPKRAALSELARGHDGRVAFVGDTEYDMREARAAGSVAIGFAGGYRPSAALVEAGADYIVERLEDVSRIATGDPFETTQRGVEREGGSL